MIKQVVSSCVPCILASRKRGKKEGELYPIPKGDIPLATNYVDHIGPMDATSKQYKHMFVVIDAFTKLVWYYPTKIVNVKEVLDRLHIHQEVFGNPSRIIADRDAAFTSNEFRDFCEEEGITLNHITTGVPRENGQVERIHQVIKEILTKMAIENPEKWYKNVSQVQRCLNNTFQRNIGMSPFELLIGTKMKQPSDVKFLDILYNELAEMFCEDREKLRKHAKQSILLAQMEQKRQNDKKTKQAQYYLVGDIVAIQKHNFRLRLN